MSKAFNFISLWKDYSIGETGVEFIQKLDE